MRDKGYVVVNALSRKKEELNAMIMEKKHLEIIAEYNFRPTKVEIKSEMLAILSVRPTLLERIGASQRQHVKLAEILNRLEFAAESEDLKPYGFDREG